MSSLSRLQPGASNDGQSIGNACATIILDGLTNGAADGA